MTRVNPVTGHGYVLVAHTACERRGTGRSLCMCHIDFLMLHSLALANPNELVRTRAKFICGFAIDISSYEMYLDTETLKGLPSKLIDLVEVPVECKTHVTEPFSSFGAPEFFPPGSIMIFATQLESVDIGLDKFCMSNAGTAFDGLDLVDLNVILYRTEAEERDATGGEIGVYNVPNMDVLTYCGLEGWMYHLRHIAQSNDLSHPLCRHLKQGTQVFDYVVSRLSL